MADILSPSGLRRPKNPDTGATFWNDLADAITRLNDHTHTGTDSTLLGKTQSILAANWGADLGGGVYKQTITLAAGLDFDLIQISIRDASGSPIYPNIEKVSDSSYDIYTNDNTVTWTAVYT